MHYGTVIPEGIQLINEITGTKTSDPVSEMVRKYKVQIRNKGLKDELYKWELLKKYNCMKSIMLKSTGLLILTHGIL